MPIWIPCVVLVFSVYLVLAPIIDNPKIEYVYSICFMLAGAALYVPFVAYRLKMPGIGKGGKMPNLLFIDALCVFPGKLTQKLQLLLKLVPPSGMPDC